MKNESRYILESSLTWAVILIFFLGCDETSSATNTNKGSDSNSSQVQIAEIKAHPGYKRVKFNWKLSSSSNEAVQKILILWNSDNDSLRVPVESKIFGNGKDSVTIENVSEGKHLFDFIAIGTKGTRSTQILKKTTIYGHKYQSSLTNRRINNIAYSNDSGRVIIYWGPSKKGEIATILDLKNGNEITQKKRVLPSQDSTVIKNYSLVNKHIKFSYHSIFLPKSVALDTVAVTTKIFDNKLIYNFKHPGILVGRKDLERIKSAVKQGNNVVYKGYKKMMSSKYTNLNYTSKAYEDVALTASGGNSEEEHYRDDAHAAFANALNWVITGNAEYKNKSISILNAWANKLKKFHVTNRNDNAQITLETSWAIPIWLSAAEIIRYYEDGKAGWTSEDIDNFKSFLRLQLKYVDGPIASAPNWHGSRALARMSAGVFLNNKELYRQGYQEIKGLIKAIGEDGKPSENTRDGIHSQYNVIVTSQAAEIAYQQGNNKLYKMSHDVKPILLKQSEYYVRERMGEAPMGGIGYSSAGKKHAPPYEMIYSRYTNDFEMSMPYTKQYIQTYNRPEGVNENHFVGWGTLTHAKETYKPD